MLLVWESAEALQAFWESSLARSIASVYQITGAPHIETGSVVMTLESRKRGTSRSAPNACPHGPPWLERGVRTGRFQLARGMDVGRSVSRPDAVSQLPRRA